MFFINTGGKDKVRNVYVAQAAGQKSQKTPPFTVQNGEFCSMQMCPGHQELAQIHDTKNINW